MWSFFVLFIIILFVISQILIKINSEDNKIYSGIKIFFKILVYIFAIILSIYIFISILNAVFGIFTHSILDGFRDFLRGFGF